jgi:hypothetical protein
MEHRAWNIEHGTWNIDWFLFPSAEGNLSSISEAIYAPSAKRSMFHQRSGLCFIIPFLTLAHFPLVVIEQRTFIKNHIVNLTSVLASAGIVVTLI